MFEKEKLKAGIKLLLLFGIYTAAVMLVDVRPIGPLGGKVGLAGINAAFASLLTYNETMFFISQLLGYAAIGVCVIFGFLGFKQLISEKTNTGFFKKLTGNAYFKLGVFYIAVILIYVIFNKVTVNCRPVILPGEGAPESSYPSSHTMLALCVYDSAAIILKKRLPEGSKLLRFAVPAARVMMVLSVLTRLFSGAHWLTDIIGSVILSAALITLYSAAENGSKG